MPPEEQRILARIEVVAAGAVGRKPCTSSTVTGGVKRTRVVEGLGGARRLFGLRDLQGKKKFQKFGDRGGKELHLPESLAQLKTCATCMRYSKVR
ncbi:MAG TPA: hypothetical protein VMH81_14860 [Bryobacteraceae bacterium]|nr:hypothetical protein [Bryobacteraceae bacterium]